jgi:hypothetical protein
MKLVRIGKLALLFPLSCGDGPVALERPAPRVVTVGGVSYAASAQVVARSPLVVRTEVRATNTSPGPVELRVASHCAVLLRVYDNAAYAGRPVWDGTRYVRSCTTLLRPIVLAAGETRAFAAESRPLLERGRYFFLAILRQADRDIEMAAGDSYVDTF